MRWREVGTLMAKAHGFALIMLLVAIIPGLNYLYSGHGGLAWMFLPFALPIALATHLIALVRGPSGERAARVRRAGTVWALYLPISGFLAVVGSVSIKSTFGLSIAPLEFWGAFFFPINWAFGAR